MRKSKLFDCSTPRFVLYSLLILHFCHFRKTSKNRCKKGCQKLSFLVPKPALAAQGPIDSAFFDDLGELEKSSFFGNSSGSQTNLENWAEGRQKAPNPAPSIRRGWWFMPAGSPGRPRARPESRKRPIGKRQKGPEGKKASGKVEKRKSWKGKVRKKERKRDDGKRASSAIEVDYSTHSALGG